MENDVLEAKLDEHERRIVALEQDTFKQEIRKAIEELKVSVAKLDGKLAGFLLAGGVLGAGVAILLQYILKK